ncbi:MAG TPA: hypothetical protein VNK46_01080 [Nitrospiraceae bacterium]|jgi:hypothetical protein|nr:hypothetical protein [Nitrospiraceae bacterium]
MIIFCIHVGFVSSVHRAGSVFRKNGRMLARVAIVAAVLCLSAGTFPISLPAFAEHLVYPQTTGEF